MATLNQNNKQEECNSFEKSGAASKTAGEQAGACSHGGIHKKGECASTKNGNAKQRSEFDLDSNPKDADRETLQDE